MNAVCDERLIGRRLLIETAIVQLCDRLCAEPDVAKSLDNAHAASPVPSKEEQT